MTDVPATIPAAHFITVADRQSLVARYRRLRAASLDLNNRLVRRISERAIQEGGKKLGMLHGRELLLDHEDQSSVLMDYCLYEVRSDGRTIVESLVDWSPAGPDEAACIAAMQVAWYSLFVVEAVEPDVGVVMRDLRTDEIVLVVDMGFARTGQPGLVIATRLIPFEGFAMTGGAALPLGVVDKNQQQVLTARFLKAVSASPGRFDPALFIRESLQRGCGARVRYEDLDKNAKSGGASRETTAPSTLGRNSPCPCGSGKKYKQCCMRR
jgi:hypothetical protein